MVYQLRLRKKGIIILPKDLRTTLDLKEDDVLVGEVRNGELVLKPLKPKVVRIDPGIVEKFLEEEGETERRKGEDILGGSG
jgi:AbrB family looped-hinge helix DNA binding protein